MTIHPSSCMLIYASAVVAKAPRKNIVSGRSSVISPNGGAPGKRKGKAGGSGGNPLKLWPVPKGQKGLQSFFGGHGSDDASGSSPMEGTSTSEQLEGEEFVGTPVVEEGSGSSCAESSSSCEDNLTTNSVNLLDDITQLNSDSDED